MPLISFAWTVPALRAYAKTCTRRNWSDKYAEIFINAYRLGLPVAAWDRLPRVHGQKIGILKLTQEPFKQRTSLMTNQDYIDEGLFWMESQCMHIRGQHPRAFFEGWRSLDEEVYVIRFRFTPET